MTANTASRARLGRDQPDDAPCLTTRWCAEQLHVKEQFIRDEIAKRRLKALKISHKVLRIRPSAWQAYLAAREHA
jgi:hypothetical protein